MLLSETQKASADFGAASDPKIWTKRKFLFFPCNPLKFHKTTKEFLGESKEILGDSKEILGKCKTILGGSKEILERVRWPPPPYRRGRRGEAIRTENSAPPS
jgi:hypothetical protein